MAVCVFGVFIDELRIHSYLFLSEGLEVQGRSGRGLPAGRDGVNGSCYL